MSQAEPSHSAERRQQYSPVVVNFWRERRKLRPDWPLINRFQWRAAWMAGREAHHARA